jgi:cyclopropane-fatty-acyl-phospholipid synthase
MMSLDLVSLAMNATERGFVPDPLIRLGIRRLLKQRLQAESRGSCEDWQHRARQFVQAARRGPIAPVPDVANEQHYEVPPEFFLSALGHRLKYSSCYWPAGVQTLDQAEEAALETTCRRAEIQDGMTVLDLGCGWGSLSLWIAEKYPRCRVTAVSNSTAQKQFIERQARASGLLNLRVITVDMNVFATDDQFDRVISVEMFEHMRNHKKLLKRIASWLTPDGRLFVHIFCHRQFVYPFETDGSRNWMGRHFFTGGMMPSDDLLVRYQHDLRLVNQWRWNGGHYARTCNAWLANVDRQRREIMPLFEETYGAADAAKWFVRWRLFFIACAELFGYHGGNEWWVSHYLFERQPRLAAVHVNNGSSRWNRQSYS